MTGFVQIGHIIMCMIPENKSAQSGHSAGVL